MSEENNSKWISGFWRRIGAFVIDCLILGVMGLLLGLALEKQLVELGGWGRLVGFLIALVYFGLLNSKLSGGQTPGKRALNLRVVNVDNQNISIARSFVRYSILGAPFFLNEAHFSNDILVSSWVYIISLIVFGGLLSTVYLYVFNRVTRQTLHDLIVGTFVVNAGAEKQEPGRVWWLHLGVVAVLFVVAALAPIFTSGLMQDEPFKDLLSTQKALMNNPSVSFAGVYYGQTQIISGNSNRSATSYVSANVFLKRNLIADKDLAHYCAEVLVNNFSGSRQKDVVVITLIYGYDIGIAARSYSQVYQFKPGELMGQE